MIGLCVSEWNIYYVYVNEETRRKEEINQSTKSLTKMTTRKTNVL